MSEEKKIPEEAPLHRIYDYKPYTFHRICRIFLNHFDIEMQNVWQGYKCNRRPGYCERYNLVERSTGKVVAEMVSLEQCRRVLAKFDFPEKDEKSDRQTTGAEKERAYLNFLKKKYGQPEEEDRKNG